MRLLGAALLSLSCFTLGLAKAGEQRRSVSELRELTAFLELLKAEICSRRTPFGEALANISPCCAGEFCRKLQSELLRLGEKSFAELWSECVKSCYSIPEDCTQALCTLGISLGRYGADEQSEAIDSCRTILQQALNRLRPALRDRQKLCVALYGTAGLVAAIVLI